MLHLTQQEPLAGAEAGQDVLLESHLGCDPLVGPTEEGGGAEELAIVERHVARIVGSPGMDVAVCARPEAYVGYAVPVGAIVPGAVAG